MSHGQISRSGNRKLPCHCQILTIFCGGGEKRRENPKNGRQKPASAAIPPLDKTFPPRHAAAMAFESESPLDSLWKEYGRAFQDWDDLTLARWLAQTLGELEGRAWRLSHPLVGAYRLAAQIAHDRQIWFKRLATPPAAYAESPCCRAPMSAAAHARRARVRLDLPALQRNARAVR